MAKANIQGMPINSLRWKRLVDATCLLLLAVLPLSSPFIRTAFVGIGVIEHDSARADALAERMCAVRAGVGWAWFHGSSGTSASARPVTPENATVERFSYDVTRYACARDGHHRVTCLLHD